MSTANELLEPIGSELRCDLCADVWPLSLRAKCHPTAPLRVEIADGELKLFCYVPECNRLVAGFRIVGRLVPENFDWLEYEARKKEIQARNLSPEEYEKSIRQMVEELNSGSDDR